MPPFCWTYKRRHSRDWIRRAHKRSAAVWTATPAARFRVSIHLPVRRRRRSPSTSHTRPDRDRTYGRPRSTQAGRGGPGGAVVAIVEHTGCQIVGRSDRWLTETRNVFNLACTSCGTECRANGRRRFVGTDWTQLRSRRSCCVDSTNNIKHVYNETVWTWSLCAQPCLGTTFQKNSLIFLVCCTGTVQAE